MQRIKTLSRDYSQAKVVEHINKAINARRIMINEISGFNSDTRHLPYLIWWPLKPQENALERLVEKCLEMKEQIAIACIFCDYQSTYTKIQANPDWTIWLAAQKSPNPFYLADVERHAAEQDIKVDQDFRSWYGELNVLDSDLEPTMEDLLPLYPALMDDGHYYYGQRGTYVGGMPNAGMVERYVWLSPAATRRLEVLVGTDGYCQGDTDWLEDEYQLSDEELPEERPEECPEEGPESPGERPDEPTA